MPPVFGVVAWASNPCAILALQVRRAGMNHVYRLAQAVFVGEEWRAFNVRLAMLGIRIGWRWPVVGGMAAGRAAFARYHQRSLWVCVPVAAGFALISVEPDNGGPLLRIAAYMRGRSNGPAPTVFAFLERLLYVVVGDFSNWFLFVIVGC